MVKRCFFNITIGGEDQGRIVFELWDEVRAPARLRARMRWRDRSHSFSRLAPPGRARRVRMASA
jgi:hypothetical protein